MGKNLKDVLSLEVQFAPYSASPISLAEQEEQVPTKSTLPTSSNAAEQGNKAAQASVSEGQNTVMYVSFLIAGSSMKAADRLPLSELGSKTSILHQEHSPGGPAKSLYQARGWSRDG